MHVPYIHTSICMNNVIKYDKFILTFYFHINMLSKYLCLSYHGNSAIQIQTVTSSNILELAYKKLFKQ